MALRRINPGNNPLPLAPRTFSSSSNPRFPPPPPPPSDDPNATSPPDPHPREGPNPAAASLFQGIRERLKSSPAPPPRRGIPITPPPRPSGQPPPPSPSLDDVRRSLQSFRGSRDTGSTHGPSSPDGAAPFFQNLLRDGASMAPPHGAPTAGAKTASLQGVHESLGYTTPMTLQSITDSLKNLAPQHQLRPRHSSSPFMSPDHGIFAKEQRERGGKPQGFVQEEGKDSATTLRGDYSYEELGRRLGNLRPAGLWMDGKEWFSLDELQGRIAKLVEWEKKETDPRLGGEYAVFRASLKSLDKDKDTKKIGTMQRVSTLLSSFSGRPMQEYMLQPPQEELLERYFHPDHMSSEDKMKLELQRVRDEFKMSENDCGSARVQIAQLTLKIKHLSAVLHKKDKHSRKGLQDMVQRRKKYLKYLRRTDWDSYCLVLSKLGLRDVPEYKAPDYKKTQPTTKAKSKKSKSKRKRKIKA